MSEKLDRRKQYTRMVLKNSLIELLQDKPINMISVKEICQMADINRSTFYAHYTDLYDLLKQLEEEIIQDIKGTLTSYTYTKEEDSLAVTIKLLEYIAEHSNSCQTLFSEHGSPSFQNEVIHIAQDCAIDQWVTYNNIPSHIAEYISLFMVNGSIRVIQQWLKNGMDQPPKEMAEMIHEFSERGISAFT
ncbi:TetR/AcrR family transcriptional regulator [Halalkalibacter sp. APA_J-10(15)]|uniref:TetR/AcrR family transcriptional regulator n=1 Tax=unclassified Halalkalibacter TaxID=2893063 RepID=UPI001FF6C2B9|nr:TetR-like C-terminal domain-containing protein [Halalkalibacter sp. APA_J-10(15)]MCK0471302.1 TetR family transcriptional regulator C-terminal domain-containing protein [Halalkalibacter sp. APA_J-10(15)]